MLKLNDGILRETVVRSNGSTTITQSPEQTEPRLFPIFAYGCRRGSALGGAAREVVLGDDDGPEIATLFDEGAGLIHAETWLLQWEGDAAKNSRSKAIFETVVNAVKTLLDLVSVDIHGRRIWVTERDGTTVPFSALSDGYLTSAGWLLDLVARWITLAEQQQEEIGDDFMRHMKGLVLIDELDLHLHPRFQVNVITRVRQLLPQMSFVVTTHNPLTLVGARSDEIWILSSAERCVTATAGGEAPMLLTGGQIYRRYFGIDDIYPDGLGRKLHRYGFLSGYALRNDDEEAELVALRAELREAGVEPGWEIAPQVRSDTGSGRAVSTERPHLSSTEEGSA